MAYFPRQSDGLAGLYIPPPDIPRRTDFQIADRDLLSGRTLELQPRGKFAELGITAEQVTVEEVGFYSLYDIPTEKRQRDKDTVEAHTDRTMMRSLTMDYLPNSTIPVSGVDLNHGYTGQNNQTFFRPLAVLSKWIQQHTKNDPHLADIESNVDIVSTNLFMADLMSMVCGEPYDRNIMQNITGWIFGAARVNGRVFIGEIHRGGIHKMYQLAGRHPRRPTPWRMPATPYTTVDDNPSHQNDPPPHLYWGRRFESYLTGEEKTSYRTSKFRSVVHTKLLDLNLLLVSLVDAENPFSKEGYPAKYVDIGTVSQKQFEPGHERSLYGYYMFRWWLNNILKGTQYVHAGIHEAGQLKEIKTYCIRDIPTVVQEMAGMTSDSRFWRWSPEVCLGFLYTVLRFVLKHVVRSHDRAVYEFTCFKGNDRSFTCREIPAHKAEGHDYIPDDAGN